MAEIWRTFGLKPWRQDSFKVSPDPDLIEKVTRPRRAVHDPEAAAVFAVDERPQIQALDRTAPTLPLLPTTPQRASHDYERHGTVGLFAALDVAKGTMITEIRRRHTRNDFVAFLNTINREVPKDSPSTSSSTTSRRTRRPRCNAGCFATSGSTCISRRASGRG